MMYFHGTSKACARKILKQGFARAKTGSYTGTGVNLSECMTVSYEYGAYENNGVVLACELHPEARLVDIGFSCASDQFFMDNPEVDGVISYGGNVVVIWNTDIITSVRALSEQEAIKLLHQAFDELGDDMAYNYPTQDRFEAYLSSRQKTEGAES